jgi:hypothetical protein
VEDITPKKIVIFLACCVLIMFVLIMIPSIAEIWA